MNLSAKQIHDFTVGATDGDIGKIADLFFDDKEWIIRYLVVDAGDWLHGRTVLVSPLSVTGFDLNGKRMNVKLTREQVKNSPDIDTSKPISRQQEEEFTRYYDLSAYWGGTAPYGTETAAGTDTESAEKAAAPLLADSQERGHAEEIQGESHLRSVRGVNGYAIQARDGDAGHLTDFVFDDQTWRVNYMVVDTSNLPGSKAVTLAPSWVRLIDLAQGRIRVDLNKETINKSSPFDLAALNEK